MNLAQSHTVSQLAHHVMLWWVTEKEIKEALKSKKLRINPITMKKHIMERIWVSVTNEIGFTQDQIEYLQILLIVELSQVQSLPGRPHLLGAS